MKKIFLTGLYGILLFGTFKSYAHTDFEYIPYVGLDYGYVDAKAEKIKPEYNLLNLNVGTKYNDYFGTEAFFEQTWSDTKKTDSDNKVKTSYRAYGLDVAAYLPIGCYKTVDLFTTFGIAEYVFYGKTNHEKHTHQSGVGYRFALGMKYNFNENLSLRILSRYIDMNDISKVNHLYEYSVGFRYHFY